MIHLDGFAPLAEGYDGFILDLWGVIHDGVTPYPGAVDCLARLRAAGKATVLLSNAPRRSYVAQAAMRAIGIDDALYGGILTSGEATYLALRDRTDPWLAGLGNRALHIGPPRDRSVIEGLDIAVCADPAGADFVLNTGPDDLRSPHDVSEFEDELRACADAGLPMLCANPDLEVIRGGERVICAGALAARYGELGGDVREIGKPHPDVYAAVLCELGLRRERVLAVGDALRTDIAGAAAVGIDACWVLGGIHGEELGFDPARAAEAAREAGFDPVASVMGLTWS